MKKGLFFILLWASVSCNGIMGEQGNGERITKTFTVDDFDEIDFSGAFDIHLDPSNQGDIILEVDENLVQYIQIYVRGNRLIIDSDRSLSSREGIKIEIPVNQISKIVTSGASDIISTEAIRSRKLNLEMSGGGKLDLKLDVESVDINVSGAALVYLRGQAKEMDISMSGAGSIEAEDFEVEDCDVSISGVGSATVNVTGKLVAEVSGLGSVKYVGNPKSVRGDVSGIGVVSKSKN